jgi:8-oxo-dGTP pyrophosphatase MutT (NUDIX family)
LARIYRQKGNIFARVTKYYTHFMLTPIIAAGGIVVNPNKEILWIFRRGFWDLPKGKLDPNETIEACALREVMEETGVSNLVLGDLIMTTTHLYHDMYLNTEVEKTTYWYKMTTDQLQDGIPQTEEDIEAIAWVKKEDIAPYLAKTYDTIKQVMASFLTSMNE